MVLWGALAAEGRLDLCALPFATFAHVGLPIDSSDRDVWRFAQTQGMILLTHNRNMRGAVQTPWNKPSVRKMRQTLCQS